MKEAKLQIIGSSSDNRTNKWFFTCECGYGYKLRTTILNSDFTECPKCNQGYVLHYNDLKIFKA